MITITVKQDSMCRCLRTYNSPKFLIVSH